MDMLHDIAVGFLEKTSLIQWTIFALGFTLIEIAYMPYGAVNKNVRLVNAGCGLALSIIAFFSSPYLHALNEKILSITGPGFIKPPTFDDYPMVTLGAAIFVCILVRDFFFYVWHRLEHKFSILWDIHAVHHSEETLNSTSYMRQSWVDGIAQALVISVPAVVLIDTSDEAQYYSYLIAIVWNFFAHADLRLHLGFLTPVVTGPQLHRLHHSVEKRHQNSNYAQYFPIFDILFGTYIPPGKDEYPATGLGNGEYVRSLREMVTYTPARWAQRLLQRKKT